MSIFLWIILGAISGYVASKITGSQSGIVFNIILGIIGSFIGAWIMNIFGSNGVTGFNLSSIAVSILGAVVLIWVVKFLRK